MFTLEEEFESQIGSTTSIRRALQNTAITTITALAILTGCVSQLHFEARSSVETVETVVVPLGQKTFYN